MAKSAKQFLEEIATLAEDLRRQIEAKVDNFPPDDLAREKRRADCAKSLELFAFTYMPHYVNPKGLAYDKWHESLSALHGYLFKRIPEIVFGDGGVTEAIAAPRGEMKTTIVSQAGPLWCICYGYKHFMPMISDTFEQAAAIMEAIKAEIEINPRIAMDFPEIAGKGRVWNERVILTRNDVKMQPFGSGKRMRGLRHGPHRPDMVFLDDLENDENVATPAQRDKLNGWLNKTVLNLGGPDGSLDVLAVGTVLHYDSVLSRVLANPLWKSRRFKAIIKWPDRMDLWDAWEELIRNGATRATEDGEQGDHDGEEAAEAFYQQNLAEMERGAVVSWPKVRPLKALMRIRARDGHGAFDSEYQNDPVSGENAIFAGCIQFWVNRLAEWRFYGACDPSLGLKGKSRDPSAILVGGFNRLTGILDVIEAKIAKRVPDKIIQDIIGLQAEYKCLRWAVEAVQFQEFMRRQLVAESAKRGIPVPAMPVIPHNDKDLRIESLQPHVANGLIRFHPSLTTLISQLTHYPKADHDDGPDCLEMLWKLCGSRSAPGSGWVGSSNLTDHLAGMNGAI
jgi:predicted phage terminase large subunit-like protein